MSCMNSEERNELVDLVAQAVIDRIEDRERINQLAESVLTRVLSLQADNVASPTPNSYETNKTKGV